MAKHFILSITDGTFTFKRNEVSIKREADLVGIYVIHTNILETTMDAPEAVWTYKCLAHVEQIFKNLKAGTWASVPFATTRRTAPAPTCS